ncbi:MAG: Gfo/Idh/MocA family oxidoreductase [Thermodesulfobacteriota bacterium]
MNRRNGLDTKRRRGGFAAAVVGCGAIGSLYDEGRNNGAIYTHAGMYCRLEDFILKAGADRNEERLREFGRAWRVTGLYTSLETMLLRQETDIISIATPDHTHAPLIETCLALRPPRIIFTEKPLAENLEAGRKLIESCRAKNVHLVVDYVRRWDSTHRRIREFLENRGLGRIQTAVGYYVRGLRHNGCHLINLAHFLFGRFRRVRAFGRADQGSLPGDPSLHLHLETADDVGLDFIALDRRAYDFSLFELDILGETGRLRLLDGGRRFELYRVEPHPDFPNFKHLDGRKESWLFSTYEQAMLQAGRELAAVLRGEAARSVNDAAEALDDLAVIEAALRSSRADGRFEEVDYPDQSKIGRNLNDKTGR